jgi:hypothetical protein
MITLKVLVNEAPNTQKKLKLFHSKPRRGVRLL